MFLLASSSSNLHLALEHFVAEREVPGTRISTLTSETMVLIWKRLELLPQVEEFKWVKFKYLSITLFTRGKTGWEMDRCLQWHGCCNSKESWRKTKLLFYWASYIPILTYCVPLTSSVGWFFLLKESFFSSHCRQVLGDRGVLWFLRFSLNYCRVFTLQYIKGIFVMIWLYINNIELRGVCTQPFMRRSE